MNVSFFLTRPAYFVNMSVQFRRCSSMLSPQLMQIVVSKDVRITIISVLAGSFLTEVLFLTRARKCLHSIFLSIDRTESLVV